MVLFNNLGQAFCLSVICVGVENISMWLPPLFQGQSTLVEQIKKSYSTNDLRVRDGRGRDSTDGDMPYIDDSDEEFGKEKTAVKF